MLGRYSMKRGQPLSALPREVREGRRIDTRKHTKHFLRPDADAVARYLADPSPRAFELFRAEYEREIRARFKANRSPFDDLVTRAGTENVFLGCNCPTAKNPDVNQCHTVLALHFFAETYPDLEIEFP